MLKMPKTLQKRPLYNFGYMEIALPEDFSFVVSRLSEQNDREITALHAHNVVEFGICIDGSGIFVVEDKILPFHAGDASIITNREMHLAQSTKGTSSHWYWIYVNLEKILYPSFPNSEIAQTDYLSGADFNNIVSMTMHPGICSTVREIAEVHQDRKPFKRERLTSLLCLLMTELKTAFGRKKNRPKKEERSCFEPDTLQRIQKAVAYIANHYTERFNISLLAKLSGLSRTHFRRLFEKALGKSPLQYLIQVRVAMASAELKQSRKPVSMIAHESGFTTLSSFNRHFRKQTGMSPRDWRR
ncbi:MAG: AraC family transcriptional regulator [Victivallales bacterium]|jgi:AraC-like DNA-binding protein